MSECESTEGRRPTWKGVRRPNGGPAGFLWSEPFPASRAGYDDIGSSSGRQVVDRSDAVAAVRRERPRVSRRPPAHGLHGANGHLLRMADLPAVFDRGVPRRGPPAPTWMRFIVLGQGVGMLAVGVTLFLAPEAVRGGWPWALTTLTARAIGAWLIGIGFAAFHASRENDFLRIRPLAGGYIAFAILQFIAIVRYSGDVNWSGPAAWVYIAFLASVLPVGLFGWFGHRAIGTP